MDQTLKVFDIRRNDPFCKENHVFINAICHLIYCATFLKGTTTISHKINLINGDGTPCNRYYSPFQATWHPQREDVLLVGSTEQPKRV